MSHPIPRLFWHCLALAVLLAPAAARSQTPWSNETSTVPDPQMEEHFRSPPASVHPWVFWMWLNVDTNQAAITRDLEEMRAKGIEGAIIYDTSATRIEDFSMKMIHTNRGYQFVRTDDFKGAHSTGVPGARMPTWTPRSREMYRFAAKEAGRLGVKLCVSAGLAGTSGAIEPEYGQQKLVWSETGLTGPRAYDGILPIPIQAVPATARQATKPAKEASKPGSFVDLQKPVAVLAVPDREGFGSADVIDLSAKMDAGGHLHWDAPAGNWKILRFAYEPTGARNFWGLFTDHMSAGALDKTWDVTMGPLLKEMKPEERRGLVGVEDDSWEAGASTWTPLFLPQFQQLRHYDLLPWLPALAGKKMGAPDEAENVRRDFFRTVADLIAKNHYAHLREIANREGLALFSEPAGPNTEELDYLLNCKQVDFAMAEFWAPSQHRPTPERRFLLRNAANANHLYGKRVTACESFTSVGQYWEESLFDLKNTADQAFCDGCNLPVIHNYSHSPSVDAKPGYAYFAGTFYNRGVTWWEQTPAFNAYLGRCSLLLQQGLFVADALYYRGDDIGLGEPMKTRPALPAEGYDHDNCNLDALLTRVSVRDGRLVLPDGMSYRLLVLPDKAAMAPEALAKVAELLKAGATVVGSRPTGMAGKSPGADARARFDAKVALLWGSAGVGEHRVVSDRTPAALLATLKVAPDFEFEGLSGGGDLDWIHRTAGGTEIYFVASRWDPEEKLTCTFRVSGKQPELWDPVTGEIRDAVAFRQENGRTIVPLEFEPRGSVFVIFRKSIAATAAGSAASNEPIITPQAELAGTWEVNFDPRWGGPGRMTFDTLADWTRRSEDGIRHYSGAAVYRKKFDLASLPAAGTRLLLNLGEVHEAASVRLNGVDLGVLWTRPARVDITRAAREGANELEITVVNLWPNRLIADESLPSEKRLTETNIHKFSAATPLYPSGLLGPVVLEKSSP